MTPSSYPGPYQPYQQYQMTAGGPPFDAAGGWPEAAEPELNLMEYLRLVWAQKLLVLAVVAITTTVAGARALIQPKMYRSVAKIAVDPPPRLSNSQFDASMNYWQMDRYIADQLEVLKTKKLGRRVLVKLGVLSGGEADDQVRMEVEGLIASVRAKQLEQTNVLEVSLVGTDPVQTAERLNIYLDEFIATNIEDGFNKTRQIYEVIQNRLEPLKRNMQESERALMTFREREDALLFADQDKNVITEQVNTLTTEYAQAKAERIRLETKLAAIRQLSAKTLATSGFPEVMEDETINSLRGQKDQAEIELAEKLRNLKEGHPQVKELRSRIDSLDKRIEEHIGTIRRALQTDFDIVSRREQSLYENMQQLKDQSISLSKQTLELDSLRRDYEQNKQFFEDMLSRSKEADISGTSAVNTIRVIEPAEAPGGHFSPNVPRTLAVGLALGLFLGIGLVLGLDFLDHTLRTPEHVERYIGVETLCTLPVFTAENARILRESFQSLRTALILASRGEGCQILMVTSAVPSEGKTTVAFNLGKVMANGGARVLLIDADLRKPRLHRLIQAKNARGLTSLVLGEAEIADCIHSVADAPNLDLVTSGPLPPNPPELFGKTSYRRLLAQARETYDWVLIDTPPVASVTDPVICSALVDMVLVVTQYGHAKRQLVKEIVRSLRRTGARVAGVVLNKVDVEKDHYYYSYYYSYYRYGGYGHYGEEETGTPAPGSGTKKGAGGKKTPPPPSTPDGDGDGKVHTGSARRA